MHAVKSGEPSGLRYGDLLRHVGRTFTEIRYADLVSLRRDQGSDRGGRVSILPRHVYRLVRPYVSVRLGDQARSILPLAAYLAFFQLFILHQSLEQALTIAGGMAGVMAGLMLFMEGLKLGLMPFAENIGLRLPDRTNRARLLGIAFVLGLGATIAEPAIGVLQAAGSQVVREQAPLLSDLLSTRVDWLVLAVGAGVGLATVLGMLRLLCQWSLKPLIVVTLLPALLLTLLAAADRTGQSGYLIGLAWDCGGVTTGPVTVPLVLALGIGIMRTVGHDDSGLGGFGIVTLASLLPVVTVLGLGLVLARMPAVAVAPAPVEVVAAATGLMSHPAVKSLVLAVQAILPLVLLLALIQRFVLRETLANGFAIRYGITLCLLGMMLFNLGLAYGLGALGSQVGRLLPVAFNAVETIPGSPLYPRLAGYLIALAFAFILGFGATIAEPALKALAVTVETLTNGALERMTLIYSVSVGVGVGIMLGVAKILWGLSLAWMLVPGYGVLLVMTFFSAEKYVNIAWDSAGVTTGPITVPLVVALGLGLGHASGVVEGFGILALASLCPIFAVLVVGLRADFTARSGSRLKPGRADDLPVALDVV